MTRHVWMDQEKDWVTCRYIHPIVVAVCSVHGSKLFYAATKNLKIHQRRNVWEGLCYRVLFMFDSTSGKTVLLQVGIQQLFVCIHNTTNGDYIFSWAGIWSTRLSACSCMFWFAANYYWNNLLLMATRFNNHASLGLKCVVQMPFLSMVLTTLPYRYDDHHHIHYTFYHIIHDVLVYNHNNFLVNRI